MTTPNRTNSDFQIVYFLVGSCHTADGAYAKLCNLKEDRELALFEAEKVVNQHKGSEEIPSKLFMRNYNAALKELATIQDCINRIQPLRKFADLPDDEAHEMAQVDEWRLEIINQIENNMIALGGIPPELINTARMHPDFAQEILPKIVEIKAALENKQAEKYLLSTLKPADRFKLELKK